MSDNTETEMDQVDPKTETAEEPEVVDLEEESNPGTEERQTPPNEPQLPIEPLPPIEPHLSIEPLPPIPPIESLPEIEPIPPAPGNDNDTIRVDSEGQVYQEGNQSPPFQLGNYNNQTSSGAGPIRTRIPPSSSSAHRSSLYVRPPCLDNSGSTLLTRFNQPFPGIRKPPLQISTRKIKYVTNTGNETQLLSAQRILKLLQNRSQTPTIIVIEPIICMDSSDMAQLKRKINEDGGADVEVDRNIDPQQQIDKDKNSPPTKLQKLQPNSESIVPPSLEQPEAVRTEMQASDEDESSNESDDEGEFEFSDAWLSENIISGVRHTKDSPSEDEEFCEEDDNNNKRRKLDNEEGNQVSSEIDSVDQNPSPSPSANSPESSSPAIARDTGRRCQCADCINSVYEIEEGDCATKAETWKCEICKIINKHDVSRCVGCDEPKPSHKQQPKNIVYGLIATQCSYNTDRPTDLQRHDQVNSDLTSAPQKCDNSTQTTFEVLPQSPLPNETQAANVTLEESAEDIPDEPVATTALGNQEQPNSSSPGQPTVASPEQASASVPETSQLFPFGSQGQTTETQELTLTSPASQPTVASPEQTSASVPETSQPFPFGSQGQTTETQQLTLTISTSQPTVASPEQTSAPVLETPQSFTFGSPPATSGIFVFGQGQTSNSNPSTSQPKAASINQMVSVPRTSSFPPFTSGYQGQTTTSLTSPQVTRGFQGETTNNSISSFRNPNAHSASASQALFGEAPRHPALVNNGSVSPWPLQPQQPSGGQFSVSHWPSQPQQTSGGLFGAATSSQPQQFSFGGGTSSQQQQQFSGGPFGGGTSSSQPQQPSRLFGGTFSSSQQEQFSAGLFDSPALQTNSIQFNKGSQTFGFGQPTISSNSTSATHQTFGNTQASGFGTPPQNPQLFTIGSGSSGSQERSSVTGRPIKKAFRRQMR